MSLPLTPASIPRGVVPFPARRNRGTAKSVQLNVDDDTFRRLRIRTGKFPASFFPADHSVLRVDVSKSAYYSLIARAVSQLPNNTRAARLALYDRAEVALTAAVLDPEISDEQAAVERFAFERAIRKIEHDALRKEAFKDSPEKHVRAFPSFLSIFQLFKRRGGSRMT
jgi:hypothetical protein